MEGFGVAPAEDEGAGVGVVVANTLVRAEAYPEKSQSTSTFKSPILSKSQDELETVPLWGTLNLFSLDTESFCRTLTRQTSFPVAENVYETVPSAPLVVEEILTLTLFFELPASHILLEPFFMQVNNFPLYTSFLFTSEQVEPGVTLAPIAGTASNSTNDATREINRKTRPKGLLKLISLTLLNSFTFAQKHGLAYARHLRISWNINLLA